MALAFNMGTDLESILSNPIGQPLATVGERDSPLVAHSHSHLDILQQLRKAGNTCFVVLDHHRSVYDGHEHATRVLATGFRVLS